MYRFVLCLLVLFAGLLVLPAGAYEAGDLSISIASNGDAHVDINYKLSFFEQIGVMFASVSPKKEVGDALSLIAKRTVRVSQVDLESARFTVPRFAQVEVTKGVRVYTSPRVDFESLGGQLSQHPLASLVVPDFSPRSITVRYPDGGIRQFASGTELPAAIYTEVRSSKQGPHS